MDYKAEGIKPYDEETDKTTQVREMFDSIAPAYDTMNRTMTLGIDRWWRRVAVKMLRRYSHRRILDVAIQFAFYGMAYFYNVRTSVCIQTVSWVSICRKACCA